jgi:iron complex transport system ATP-binding protein
MKDGRIVAQGTPQEVVTPGLLREVFGLDAHVVPERTEGRPHVIPLGTPGMINRLMETGAAGY